MNRSLMLIGMLAAIGCPTIVSAQGLIGGAEQGAREGNRAAGPVGGVVGGAIGAGVGTVNGALGIRPYYYHGSRYRACVRHHGSRYCRRYR